VAAMGETESVMAPIHAVLATSVYEFTYHTLQLQLADVADTELVLPLRLWYKEWHAEHPSCAPRSYTNGLSLPGPR
jgi:hypothetical protein